jgi:hypothetical protein
MEVTWSVSCHDHCECTKVFPVPMEYETEWDPGLVWKLWRKYISLVLARNQTMIPQISSPYLSSKFANHKVFHVKTSTGFIYLDDTYEQ